MAIDEKQWSSIREAFVYWANKRKANSVRSYASIREAILVLADNEYNSGGNNPPYPENVYFDSVFAEPIDGESNDEEPEIIGAHALYDLYIDQDPDDEDTEIKNISEILRHLSLEVIDPDTPEEEIILVSDIAISWPGNELYALGTLTTKEPERGDLIGVSAISRQLSTDELLPGTNTNEDKDKSYIVWDSENEAWHFYGNIYADGFGSFGGLNPNSGSGGELPVEITNALDGQILVYDSLITKWKNETPTLNTLNGVNVSGAADGQFLGYNASSNIWMPISPSSFLSSVVLAQGTTSGSLKLIIDEVSGNDVVVKDWDTLGDLAFKDSQFVLGTETADNRSQGMLKGVTSFSKQHDTSSVSPGTNNDDTYIYWDTSNNINAWHIRGNLVVDGFGSFGGIESGSGGSTSLEAVWNSLRGNTDIYANEKINPYHIPIGDGLAISGNKIIATISGIVGVNKGGTGLASVPEYSLLYGAGTNPLGILSPNTSASKKFLTMTGNGSAGAAPTWAEIIYSDITNMSFWPGSSNITTLGTITTGIWEGTAIDYDYIENLYIGSTQVQTDPTVAQSLAGLTNITASGSISCASVSASDEVQSPKFYLSDNVFFELDANNNVHLTSTSGSNIIPGFYADGFGSFGGLNSNAPSYTSLSRVWESLTNNTDYPDTKINVAHIPFGSGFVVLGSNIDINVGNGLQIVSNAIAVNDVVVQTAYSGGLKLYVCNHNAVPQPGDAGYDSHTLYFEKAS